MAESRQEMGCKGIVFLFLAVTYLAAYHYWGIEGYVYYGVGICALIGVANLALAPFVD